MSVQRAHPVQEFLGKRALVIITERVDAVALRIGPMVNRGVVERLDRQMPHHWKPRGRSWGWPAVIWLAAILTAGDPRQVSGAAYLKGMNTTRSHLRAQVIDPRDCSDDRLGHLRTHVSQPPYWPGIEEDLHAPSLAVYPLPQDVIGCDASTVAGEHDVRAGGLLPWGHRQDDPRRPQLTVMPGA